MATVVLERADWGRGEKLPLCCIYCGRPAQSYVVKDLRHTTGGSHGIGGGVTGEAAILGAVLSVAKSLVVGDEAVRTTRLRVNLPVCPRHQRAWLIWSWFGMSLGHDSLVLSGVADEFARAVAAWRTRVVGGDGSGVAGVG